MKTSAKHPGLAVGP